MDGSGAEGRVVAQSGRKRGLFTFGVSPQQRVHLTALLTLVLALAAPLHAQGDIDFDPAITEEEFSKFARLMAQALYASPVHPAGPSGLFRFDAGIAVTMIEIDTSASYWQRAVGEDLASRYGNYVGVPRLVVTKGLGSGTLAGTYAKVGDTDIEMWGGSLDVPIIDGGLLRPTLAVRGTYSQLRGIEVYDQTTYGVEVFLGKGFGLITPYAAYGRMRSDATATIPATAVTPEIILHDRSDIDRITVGARLSLGLPRLVVEATQAEERSYSAKISVGF
ncbi:MAG TPA: hypothetical protein VNA04_14535 [Thermoanaerobaculia bacterium]|nr:hypothetical protein [Thermoanaerobaculia bacterium]